jgi:hypothetical protein
MHAHQILRFVLHTTIGVVLGASGSFAVGAPSPLVSAEDTRAIYKAVGLTKRAGKLFNACDEIVQPELEVVDLNSDGQPEVFVTVLGSCQGGAAGAELSLLIKSNGHWKVNLGFPAGGYKLLTTKTKGFPDIEIGGAGFCFPVWRWSGSEYAIYKRCDR